MRGGVWIVAVHRALTAIFIDGEGHSRVHRDASDRATPTPSTRTRAAHTDDITHRDRTHAV